MKTGIKVYEAMTNKPVKASSTDSVTSCAKKIKKYNVGSLLITVGGEIRGIITEKDMVFKVLAKALNPDETFASDIMETDMHTVSPKADLFEALIEMRNNEVRRLPVKEGDDIIGLLTQKDILKIQPQLFELFVDRMVLREESTKPIVDFSQFEEGVCDVCENWSHKLSESDGSNVCPDCK